MSANEQEQAAARTHALENQLLALYEIEKVTQDQITRAEDELIELLQFDAGKMLDLEHGKKDALANLPPRYDQGVYAIGYARGTRKRRP